VPVQDLSVLTPPLLMAAVVVIAVVAFVRHEMGKKGSEDSKRSEDFPATPPISDPEADDRRSTRPDAHRSRDT
jgi:hypothetical protein